MEGPQFLKEKPDRWPVIQMMGQIDPEMLEVKRKSACLACVASGPDPVEKLLSRYSK